MKRLLATLLAVVLVCSMSSPAFAIEETKNFNVTAKYISTVEGEYPSNIENGTATSEGVTVTGAPAEAETLVVIPMTGEALQWIDACVDGEVKAAYDIHFLDANGNRINASDVNMSIDVSGKDLIVSSVTPSGEDKDLSATVSGNTVSVTADGSHYYVISVKDSDEKTDFDDTVTVPVRGDENEIHADVTVEGDTVDLHELDNEEINHIINDKVSDGLIEIDLTELDEDICKVILPVTSIEHIIEAAENTNNEHETLQVDFPHGSVKLDDKTMRAIVEQVECNEVLLVLENVGETRLNDTQKNAITDWNVYGGYEAYLFCVKGNKRISDFEGGVATLSVPFEIPNGMKAEKFAVWYVADDGKTEKLETWYEDGKLYWSVDHFSDFIIVYEGEEKPSTPIKPPYTEDNIMIWLWGTLVVISTGMIFFLVLWKHRKKDEKQNFNS